MAKNENKNDNKVKKNFLKDFKADSGGLVQRLNFLYVIYDLLIG